ncbi:MAG TPA: hypothetical protein VKV26_23810 [Dehalococcoidia bacterium]|nr:hypothetical protein [Dehalococcoidia bacterium]
MPRDRRRRDRRDRRAELPAPPPATAARGPTLAGRTVARQREWRWRTFPVFFTFAVTLFVSSILSALLLRQPGLNIIEIAGALALAIGLSHLISVRLFESRFPARRDEPRSPGRGPSQ